LGILKMQLSRPTRLDQYSTGPRDVSFTRTANSNIGIANIIRASNDKVLSNSLFIDSHIVPVNRN
jgi:hypothetical protein